MQITRSIAGEANTMLATLFDSRAMEYLTQATAAPLHVLVADPDAGVRSACAEIATGMGYIVETAQSMDDVRGLFRGAVDIVLVNLPAAYRPALELIAEVKLLYPHVVVIAMAASNSAPVAVEAMRCGASDYVIKPFAMHDLSMALERAATSLLMDRATRQFREQLATTGGVGSLIGRSVEMEKLYRILLKVAQSLHPVLILGESGTGKERVARTIHSQGPNASKPFLPVDCGSLVPTLMESELFGYVKGAFTGANRSKEGLLVAAESGTVFLDEIGELSLELQAKLLRALQEKEVRPVGATHRVPVRARIVAATNRDLGAMVERGAFRKDLFYRLNVVNLKLPALRHRKEDIPLLAAHFLERIRRERNQSYSLRDEVLLAFMQYDWPGNVRELENALERACTLASGPELSLGDLPTQMQEQPLVTQRSFLPNGVVHQASPDREDVVPLAEVEKQTILSTIRKLNGDKLHAARLLGIGKTTLYRKLKEYGIRDPLQGD